MTRLHLRLIWALLAGPAGLASAQPQTVPPTVPPAVEAFFRQPDVERAVLSPSGRWLAMTTSIGATRVGLVVFDLQDWGKLTQAARFTDVDIAEFHWVDDERLVFDTIDRERGSGDFRWAPGLFSVARDGSDLRMLVKLNRPFVTSERRIGREPLEPNHGLLHVPQDGSGEVIVGEYKQDAAGEPQSIIAKRVHATTRRVVSLSVGVPSNVQAWWFDPKGEPRLVRTRDADRERLHWRAAGEETWKQIAEHSIFEAPFTPRFIDAAGDLYVTRPSGPAATEELTRFDFAARRPRAEPLVRASGFDFDGAVVTETPGGPALGVRVVTDAETTVWFDARLKALQKEADERLPGRVNRLACRRCDAPDMVVLVRSWSDRDPGQLHVYFAARQQWRSVGPVRAGIDPRQMGEKDFFRIQARDGRDLPVWVTFPPGPRSSRPQPAVVLVHGGPWLRGGFWQWDPYAQFLATRGYIVIEPEFRGSTGYGRAHFTAGVRQWGLTMQDDVADALLWAVGKGWVDGQRACIAGGSYGGYATLMGLVRHPSLYRCGAAWAAVTDPRLMFEWSSISDQDDLVRGYDLPKLIGDKVSDAARLADAAPLTHAARIKAPLLLVVGAQDRRVPMEHGTRMRDALVEAGNPPQWVVYPDEGHCWSKSETRVDFARRLERFLAEQLK